MPSMNVLVCSSCSLVLFCEVKDVDLPFQGDSSYSYIFLSMYFKGNVPIKYEVGKTIKKIYSFE